MRGKVWFDDAGSRQNEFNRGSTIDHGRRGARDAAGDVWEANRRLSDHLSNCIQNDDDRETAHSLVAGLLAALGGNAEDDGGQSGVQELSNRGGMSEDQQIEASVGRITNPARSQLNRLSRGIPNPSGYVR